jgi:hypothetical protein
VFFHHCGGNNKKMIALVAGLKSQIPRATAAHQLSLQWGAPTCCFFLGQVGKVDFAFMNPAAGLPVDGW